MLKRILILSISMLFCCGNIYGNNDTTITIKKSIPANQKKITYNQINWIPYMKELETELKKNWKPQKDIYSNSVTVLFTIAKDGTLINKQIKTSSKMPLVDKAAMDAVEKTFPFKPLPAEYNGKSVPIEYTFYYNVFAKENHKI